MKKNFKTALTFVLVAIMFSCQNKSNENTEQEEAVSMNHVSKSASVLKREVVKEGNINSYEQLVTWYLDEEPFEELLFYSMLMSNKYKNAQATYDTYSILTQLYRWDTTMVVDTASAELALDYLQRAEKMGHHQALVEAKNFNFSNGTDAVSQIMDRVK